MPTLVINNAFTAGTTAQSAQVNANFSAITTFLNSTKIDTDNIQTGGVAESNIATSAVSTAKIAAGAVTGAKLDSGVADGTTIELVTNTLRVKDSGISTAKINDAAVTTAKITNGAVTQAKRAPLGQQISSSCGPFSTGSGSYVDVTNLSVTISTNGRPVFIGVMPGSTSTCSVIATMSGFLNFTRDSTQLFESIVPTAPSTPVSAYWFIDSPSAGTYTYKVQVRTSNNVSISNAKLVAYEL